VIYGNSRINVDGF
jgi:hypothetical protein